MLRLISLIIVILVIVSACNAIATPVPAPTATHTATATPSVSVADITAAANLRMTLPASFTPTFTATASLTATATFTPSVTNTATDIPEDVLCQNFILDTVYTSNPVSADDLEDLIEINLPYEWMTVSIEIYNLATNELVEFGTITGGFPAILNVSPSYFPEIGDYEWVMTLEDDTRSGMCEKRGTFDTRADELPNAEATAEILPETTAEATSDLSAEVTAEATQRSVPFPPR